MRVATFEKVTTFLNRNSNIHGTVHHPVKFQADRWNHWSYRAVAIELYPPPSDLIQATQIERQKNGQTVRWTDNSKYIGGDCPPDEWKWVTSFLKTWSFNEKDKCPSDLWNDWRGPYPNHPILDGVPCFPHRSRYPSLPISTTPSKHHPSPKTKKGILYLSNIPVKC